MSRGKEIKDEQIDPEEIEGDEEEYEFSFDEDDYEGLLEDPHKYFTSECYAFEENSGRGPWIPFDGPSPQKIRKYNTSQCLDSNWKFFSSGQGEPEDADYSIPPQKSDDLEKELFPGIPHELECLILARIGILEFRNLCFLSRRISQYVKSGDIIKERRLSGIREACVFMLASGEENWRAFDQDSLCTDHLTKTYTLPKLPADDVFISGDKESLCASTQLLVCGHGFDGLMVWTYDVMVGEWCKGTSMVEPRCLFASASSGDLAFVAGGIGHETNDVLSSAEKYDPDTKSWDRLPKMNEERKMCAGAYMGNKFYVFGGQDKNGDVLTCAEVFEEEKNTWVKIPAMLDGLTTSNSPPLVAVVNSNLYLFETSSNCLMVYLKDCKSWKNLGSIPVRADLNRGWGVAFKSLGNELLVIGGSTNSLSARGMTIYSCCPNPNSDNQNWKIRNGSGQNSRSHFIMNCTVMVT